MTILILRLVLTYVLIGFIFSGCEPTDVEQPTTRASAMDGGHMNQQADSGMVVDPDMAMIDDPSRVVAASIIPNGIGPDLSQVAARFRPISDIGIDITDWAIAYVDATSEPGGDGTEDAPHHTLASA